MEPEPQTPLAKVAFDHSETRAAWEKAYRRVKARLGLWTALFVAAVVVGIVLTPSNTTAGRGNNSLGAAISGLAVLVYLITLYSSCGALSRLRMVREVLRAYPWQPLPGARKLPGTKEATGVVVQFRLPDDAETEEEDRYVDGEGTWTQSMCARNPLRWNRWDVAMESGAWFAGDPERSGVLALPGGDGFMTVRRRTEVLTLERQTAKGDHERVLAAAPGRG